jgi:predicted XRE-type DNA-binding protein
MPFNEPGGLSQKMPAEALDIQQPKLSDGTKNSYEHILQ